MPLTRHPLLLAITLATFLTLTQACATKNPVVAPVPGTINTFDAYSARVIGDAQAAIMSAKAWELCSDGHFPATVTFDGETRPCDSTSGAFPASGRALLFKAEQSYNIAEALGQAYHAGADSPTDTSGLTQALTQLGIDIGQMLTGIGKGKGKGN